MLNSVNSRSKQSKVEIQTNKQIIYIFLLQIGICAFSTIYNQLWEFWFSDDYPYLEYNDTDEKYWKLNVVIRGSINFGSWILIFT